MIAIISSSTRERAALTALCASRGWVAIGCESVRSAIRLIKRSRPQTVLVRHTLSDGFSDHVLAELAASDRLSATRIIVIVAAGTPSATEARQIDLGTDCVLRDPIRTDALLAYLAKYQRDSRQTRGKSRPAPVTMVRFAGGILQPSERTLQHGERTTPLTPREIELIEHLVQAEGEIVSYEALYSEILHRPFSGETSNMRVLLGKLSASAASIGLSLRNWVEVIPKSGYRYRETRPVARANDASRPMASVG